MSKPENNNHIDYLEFATTDIVSTKKFYGQVFAWTFKDHGPEYVSFNDGSTRGGFQKVSDASPVGPLVVIYSTDLDAAKRKIVEAGGSIVREPFEFPGGRRFHFRDPGGNELAVWSDHPTP